MSKRITVNNTFINMTFYKIAKMFYNKIYYELSSTDYSKVSIYILSKTLKNYSSDSDGKNENNYYDDDKYIKNFEVYFEAEAHGSFEYPKKILNYSIFLTLLAAIEIIYTTKFLILIVDNHQMSLNTDIYTIIIQIIWSSILCCSNFFLAVSQSNLLFEYAMPSVLYFFTHLRVKLAVTPLPSLAVAVIFAEPAALQVALPAVVIAATPVFALFQVTALDAPDGVGLIV